VAKVRRSILKLYIDTAKYMFSINILCVTSNFSFKEDTLNRLIPSGGIDLFIPRIVLWRDTISRDTGSPIRSVGSPIGGASSQNIGAGSQIRLNLSPACTSSILCDPDRLNMMSRPTFNSGREIVSWYQFSLMSNPTNAIRSVMLRG